MMGRIHKATQSNFWLLFGYGLVAAILFLYTYTQVDLNLTISTANFWQRIQKSFQYVGYYLRPQSAAMYLGIIGAFYILYAAAIVMARKGKLSGSTLWRVIVVMAALLVFSYPAFSYDLFNYMFTAKTVLLYRKNPYEVIPLQFASIDPWVNIMRWTHLPSAYTPLWIALTLPAYFFGFHTFLIILWNMKLLVVMGYVLAVRATQLILRSLEPEGELTGTVIIALNPLIIVETLVSGHNDIVMMAIVLWAIVLLQRKKLRMFWFVWALSVALKLMTIVLAPVFWLTTRKPQGAWRLWSLIAMFIGLIAVVSRREMLPWYWVWVMPFVALLPKYRTVTLLAGAFSFGLLLRYAPYLYFGDWNAPVPILKWWVTVVPMVVATLIVLLRRGLKVKTP